MHVGMNVFNLRVFDMSEYPSTFDALTVMSNNPIEVGIQHNEPIGRNAHCNFGMQERGILDMCNCRDVIDQRPGWAYPDCPKMLPQYDVGELDMLCALIYKTVICEECGCELREVDSHKVDGSYYCDDCFNEQYFICEHCGIVCPLDEVDDGYGINLCEYCAELVVGTCDECGDVIFEDHNEGWSDGREVYCDECYEDHTFQCDWCGERYHNECSHSDDSVAICDSCYVNACYCEGCGALITVDESYIRHDEPYCRSCYEEHTELHDSIYCYGDGPMLRFLKCDGEDDATTFFGVENEIDYGNELSECAEALSDIQQMWMTTDGSLSDMGIEVKTHPATFEYQMKHMPWDDMCSIARRYGYKSHNTDTCGLHIHISKRGFGSDHTSIDYGIARFVFLVDKFWEQIVKFSRRTEHSIDRWAMAYRLANKQTIEDISNETYSKNGNGRHYCVNMRRTGTVEVRVFKGTLNPRTIRASIQLCEVMRKLAVYRSLSELSDMTWEKFKAEIPDTYEELIEYMGKRGL